MRVEKDQSVFSYVNAAKRLRDGQVSIPEKIAVCRQLLDLHKCLTPSPCILVAKHILTLANQQSLENGNGNDGHCGVDILSELWAVLESTIRLDMDSVTCSRDFIARILRSAIPHLERVTTCRSALVVLMGVPSVRSTKQIPALIEVLSSLIPVTNLIVHEDERSSPRVLVDLVMRIIVDVLPLLRDRHQAQALTLRLVPILLKSDFVSYLASLHCFIFQESLRKPHPFLSVLNSDNVDSIIPYLLSAYQDLQPNSSVTPATLANYFISDLTYRMSIIAGNLDLPAIPSLSNYLSAITSTFETVLSLNLELFSKAGRESAPPAKKSRLSAVTPPTTLKNLENASHDVEFLFCALVNLLKKLRKGSKEMIQVIPQVFSASAIIIEVSLSRVEAHLPLLLDVCGSLVNSEKTESSIHSAVSGIFNSLLKFFSRSRRVPLFFQLLASSSAGRPLYSRFKTTIQSTSFTNRLAWSICEMPIGGAVLCVNVLVGKLSTLSGADLENLIYLVSIVIECCKIKDKSGVARFVNEDLLPRISNISLKERRNPLMFLLGSSLLSLLQCGSYFQKGNDLVDLSFALVRLIDEKLIVNSFDKNPGSGQAADRRAAEDIPASNKGSFVLDSIKNFDLTTNVGEAVCQIRLFSIAIRVLLSELINCNTSCTEHVTGVLELLFSQFKILANSKAKYDLQRNNARVKSKLDNAVLHLISVSDVIDIFWNGSNPEVIVWVLTYCLSNWSARDEVWFELLEHQFVRQGFKKAVCEHVKNVLSRPSNSEVNTCVKNTCEACKIVLLLHKVPKSIFSNEDIVDVVSKVACLRQQSFCPEARELATIWLLGTFEHETNLEQERKFSNDWDVDWDNLKNIERRVALMKKVSKWNSKTRDPKLITLNKFLEHEGEWTETCMLALDKAGSAQRWRVLRIVLDFSEVIDASKDQRIREYFKPKLYLTICHVFNHAQWFDLSIEESSKDKSETGHLVRFVPTGALNTKCVILKLEDATDYANDSPKNAFETLEFAGLYILIRNWTGNKLGLGERLNVLRKMFQLCIKLSSVCTNHFAVLERAILCSMCCEIVLQESLSSLDTVSNYEPILLNLWILMQRVFEKISTVDKYVFSRSQCDEIVFFLKTLATCVIVILRSQRIFHWGKWVTVNLACSLIYCAHQVSNVYENASQCGLIVANLLSTLEWCRGQGHITIEVTRTILVSCAKTLCVSTNVQFEAPVMDAMTALVKNLPRDTLSILAAFASPSLTVVLNNLSHLVHRSHYNGQ